MKDSKLINYGSRSAGKHRHRVGKQGQSGFFPISRAIFTNQLLIKTAPAAAGQETKLSLLGESISYKPFIGGKKNRTRLGTVVDFPIPELICSRVTRAVIVDVHVMDFPREEKEAEKPSCARIYPATFPS